MLRPMSRKMSELATNAAYSHTVFMRHPGDRAHGTATAEVAEHDGRR